jgi:hypothetical protein
MIWLLMYLMMANLYYPNSNSYYQFLLNYVCLQLLSYTFCIFQQYDLYFLYVYVISMFEAFFILRLFLLIIKVVFYYRLDHESENYVLMKVV